MSKTEESKTKRIIDKIKGILQLKTGKLKKFIILSIVVIIGYGSTIFLGDDNKVEQISEFIIKLYTNKDVDLTPNESVQTNN